MDSPISISLEELPSSQAIEQAREDAQATLSETGSRLARLKWPLLRDATANCMKTRLSQVDPFDLLSRAWGAAVELKALATKTKAAPGKPEPYPLGKHSISASLHPVVMLRCGPLVFPALKFTVTIEGQVDSAVLIVEDGRLSAIEGLVLTPSASLSFGTKELQRIGHDPIPFVDPVKLPHGGFEIPCD